MIYTETRIKYYINLSYEDLKLIKLWIGEHKGSLLGRDIFENNAYALKNLCNNGKISLPIEAKEILNEIKDSKLPMGFEPRTRYLKPLMVWDAKGNMFIYRK